MPTPAGTKKLLGPMADENPARAARGHRGTCATAEHESSKRLCLIAVHHVQLPDRRHWRRIKALGRDRDRRQGLAGRQNILPSCRCRPPAAPTDAGENIMRPTIDGRLPRDIASGENGRHERRQRDRSLDVAAREMPRFAPAAPVGCTLENIRALQRRDK